MQRDLLDHAFACQIALGEGLDYRILLEADFLVNLHESNADLTAIQGGYHQIFVTETGRKMCRVMFGI